MRLAKEHKDQILARENKEDAVPADEKALTCNILCPKAVRSGTAIESIRKMSD